MMKRIIALLLALILTVGLLPTVALAAGETANNDVVSGSIGEDGNWTPVAPNQSNKPEGVETVSKTAKKVEGEENKYEVTLKVVLKQTEENSGKAATVLVLDTSGSMAYCAECGAEPEEDCEHNYVPVLSTPSETGTYYYKYTNKNGQVEFGKAHYCNGQHTFKEDHPAGWFKTKWYESDHNTQGDALSANNLYRKKPRASRLDAAKVGAENFLKTYSGLTFKTDGTVAANQNSRNLGRYVSVVSFAMGAALKQEWVDVSNSDVYQKVLKNIKGLSAEGGTNLDAGLTYAEYLLKKTTVKDAVKNVIALTDGQPTYCLKKNCNDIWHLLGTKLTIGSTKYCVHGDGTECTDEIYNSTVDTATRVKNVPSKLYTVCFDAGETIDVPNNGGQISVSEYLSTKIATQPTKTGEQFAYDADNAEKLYAEFAKITQSIVSGLSTGTVKDTLPTGITSTAFETASVEWDLVKDFHPESVTKQEGEKQVTTYTYTKTYTVTIDPKTVKTEKVDGVDYAPLNGETTLTVGSGADAKEIPFPIPAGKVTFPQTTYTLNYDLNGGDANTLITQQTATTAEEKHTFTIHNVTPTREGYTFAGWTESQTPTAEDTRYQPNHRIELTKANNTKTLYAQWTPATNTGYTVEHYLQKLEGDGYTKQETEELTGTTGENVNAAPKSYTGFTCDEKVEGTIKSGTIAADGSLVLKLYYTRNSYTVTYTDGVDGAEVFADDEHNNVAYGSTIPAFKDGTPTRAGYNFNGWTSSVEGVTPSSAMPASNVTFTATWTEKNKATINYEVVGPAGCGSVNPANEWKYVDDLTAATGSTATANTGYRFVGWYAEEACNTPLSANAKYVPETPTEKWANATYYAKFEQIQVDVNLSPYVKKTLEVDGTLPTGFSETFKVDVTVDGQRLQQQGTVTMTATGTSNFNMPTVALTEGTHTIMVQEVVDPQTKNSNIAYGTNPESFVLNVTASGVQYGSTDSEGHFVEVTGSPFVTITNKYTQPTETFDLNTLITKNFEARTDSKPIPNGNYTFTAQIFEADEQWQQVGETPAYIGTATLDGAGTDVAFDFGSGTEGYRTLVSGTHRYLVKEERGGETINGITYDSTVYRLTITVSEDGTQPNVQIEAEPQASVLSVQSVEFTSKIIFTNTYFEEKDPNECTIDFSKFVKKELTATGSKTVDEATFIVDVAGSYDGEAIANALPPTETQATTDEDVLNTTLTATIKNIVGGNVYEEPFTGSVTVSKPGHYTFTLTERKGTQSGVTYDEAHYQVFVNIMRVGDNLVIHDATTYLNNEQVELIKLVNDVPVTAGYIVFKNTIDTGKDDYYPIIIPTIINKDTGMLNKTDHFAYVIGYPDGTVHPNGQITRAEVATIFFRLLRDEVRDGAFTTSNSYSDVAYGKWYNNPISTMSALGIITGYPDGTFKPNKPITRAEFAAIAARFDETQSGKSATFSDVIGHWAAKEIGIAYANEWIKGYPDGTFKPDQNITRAEAMTLINRVLERKPESPADLLTNMNKWTDNLDTSKWYYLDVQEATNSHGYTRKTFNYELWRQMLPDPDWSRYER